MDYLRCVNASVSVPPVWFYATGSFSLVCLLFGLFSNGLVICIFIRDSNLRRPRNFFIFNLALTDLGLLVTNAIPHIIASFKKKWIFRQAGCNFYAVCGGIFGLASIATMAAIAITRLAAVIDPFSSLKLRSQFTIKCILCSWLYGSIWIMPPLFGWNRFIFEGFGTTCTFDYMSKVYWDRLYVVILTVGGFLAPLLIIVFSYTCILITLKSRGRPLKSQHSDDQGKSLQLKEMNVDYFQPSTSLTDVRCPSETTTIYESYEENNVTKNIRRTEARARRTALIICSIFCIAWGPYSIMSALPTFGYDSFINPYTTATLGLFAKTAACVNPLIYALSSFTFRQRIVRFVKFLCRCE